ncbi:hypothetical protein BBO01nite_47510 [Brevibacillus borstelensis]|nr:hypothetical protein BBO01nite_47510 [Brevibacillus borstelensis]
MLYTLTGQSHNTGDMSDGYRPMFDYPKYLPTSTAKAYRLGQAISCLQQAAIQAKDF